MSVPILTAEIIDTWHGRQRRQERFAHTAIFNLVALRNKLHASKSVSGTTPINNILISNTIEFPAPADGKTFAQFSVNCWAPGPLLSRNYFGYPLPLMTSTIAAEVSPDWTGLAFDYDFGFGPPQQPTSREHCASSGLEWEKRSKERLCSVSLRGKQRCLP